MKKCKLYMQVFNSSQKIVDKGGVVMYDVHFVDDKKIDEKEWEILSGLKNLR